ncbi:HdeD family acid-resistance protein [Corynebacterium nuruki]|uniref:HdeD family acid-resistance protein n=1 Tax=Corynebacterium nuruki TaxID=1032851 RepID=UPI0039BFE9DB
MTTPDTFPSSPLFDQLKKNGFQFLLWRGIVAVIAGILFLVWPFGSATVFGIFIGAWLVIDGLVTSGLSFDLRRAGAPWGWTLTDGIIGVIAGVLVILFPASFAVVSAFFILGFMALGLVFQGVLQLSVPAALRSGWSVTAGIINILLGVVLGALAITNPVDNVWSLAWLAGIAALVIGIFLIWLSFKVRNAGK